MARASRARPPCAHLIQLLAGLWFFTLTSLWVLIVVMPVNIVGNEVSVLEAQPGSSSTTYSTLDRVRASACVHLPFLTSPCTRSALAMHVEIARIPGLSLTQLHAWTDASILRLQLTMSNIAPQSGYLWLHAVSTWVVSLIAYTVRSSFQNGELQPYMAAGCSAQCLSTAWVAVHICSCADIYWPCRCAARSWVWVGDLKCALLCSCSGATAETQWLCG